MFDERCRQSAMNGDKDAQYELAQAYFKGEGVQQSYTEAAKWYTLSAAQGHTQAQFHIGWMYYYGEGVEQSFKEAVRWFIPVAEKGDE
ncbi:MAG: sel1 repeat family protein, partial [Candidatus Methanomethylophilaceae archaeon]|nr:sel1 repeat family protein [Candidatus Methanomethylophilaceae archaeon]